MALPNIMSNKLGRTIVVRATANCSLQLSDTAVSGASENVQSLAVTRIFSSGNTTLSRTGMSNNIFTGQAGQFIPLDLYQHGIKLAEFNTANVVFTINDTVGWLIVELEKSSNYVSTY